ncbi:MAG: N-acetylmuramic acid 6-phosphate etherase [Candidatus Bipolaricaulota bacterium]|nr:N-acetylmuramic acid 6-phosphate etherase [Candidatus Bipolaricaulota bacterium]
MKTESRNQNAKNLHEKDTREVLRIINQEDSSVADAVGKALRDIELAVERFVDSFRKGGRILYVGAGTSGRIGVLDAAEIPPTFGVPEGRVIAEIAGGKEAITSAREGSEDDRESGATRAKKKKIEENDFAVGISASGRTPFVLGYLGAASKAGADTAGITNNPDTQLEKASDITIVAETGPEVIAGSTRMKAGTAQKMVLNMISTAATIRLGKVYDNLMVDVVASNEKLKVRARNIVEELTEAGRGEINAILKETGYEVKPAILALRSDLTVTQARNILDRNDGHLELALEEVEGR